MTTPIRDRDFIASLPICHGLSTEQLSRLIASLILATYPAGTVLFHKNDESRGMFIIQRGLVDIIRHEGPSGKDMLLCKLDDGQIFGEFSLIQPGRRQADARVAAESRIFELSLFDFEAMLEHDPQMGIILLRAIAQRALKPFREAPDIYLRAIMTDLVS